MEKVLQELFLGVFFWASIPFKWYQNISGCRPIKLKNHTVSWGQMSVAYMHLRFKKWSNLNYPLVIMVISYIEFEIY